MPGCRRRPPKLDAISAVSIALDEKSSGWRSTKSTSA